MTFLPIVARELRVAARRPSTYWLRTGAALAVLVLGTWLFLMMHNELPRHVALGLFCTLTGSAVLSGLLSGIRSTADCLSQEKREGTLGLLFLTDLKGYDVVLGKLAASSLNSIYGLLAMVPLLAIPLLMGGITLGEFGRMALVAVNAMFFSLAVGIGVSAMSRSARQSAVMTFLVIVFFTALVPACYFPLLAMRKAPLLARYLLLPSAGFSYYCALDIIFKSSAGWFWASMAVIHVLGWLFLGLASVVAPRTWQDRPAGVQRLRWRERWNLWTYGDLAERTGFRRRLLDQNAFFWLAARVRMKPACVWGMLGLLGCGWVWGYGKFKSDWLIPAEYFLTAVCLNLLLRGWVASEVTRQLAEDRKAGALELLLSTSLTVRDILRGQWLALRRQFLGPLVVVLCVEMLFLQATMADPMNAGERGFYFCLWTAGMVMLLADLAALYWLGLWFGLTARNPNSAASAVVVRILVLPWVGMALLFLALTVGQMQGIQDVPAESFFLAWWFAFGLAADIGFGFWARHKLLTEFRLAAAQRYTVRPGFWRRLFGGQA
jgi:hypothetical protein